MKPIYQFIKYAILTALVFVFMFPFGIAFMNSFKTKAEITSDALKLPSSFSNAISNYTEAIDKMKFASAFGNSVLISVGSVVVIVFFSSMTSHFFVRNKLKINKIMFFSMVAAMIIPFQALMLPLVNIYGQKARDIFGQGFLDSRPTLIFMHFGFQLALAIFIYDGFIKSIPLELEEAAYLDGCTRLQTFFYVVFPLLKPVTMSIIILDTLHTWNDYLLPSLILREENVRTLPLSMTEFSKSFTSDYNLLLAGLMMTMIPIIIIYLFLQKYITEGITQGSIK